VLIAHLPLRHARCSTAGRVAVARQDRSRPGLTVSIMSARKLIALYVTPAVTLQRSCVRTCVWAQLRL
jgi:hypothetical protein